MSTSQEVLGPMHRKVCRATTPTQPLLHAAKPCAVKPAQHSQGCCKRGMPEALLRRLDSSSRRSVTPGAGSLEWAGLWRCLLGPAGEAASTTGWDPERPRLATGGGLSSSSCGQHQH